jgi:hypothetical protein
MKFYIKDIIPAAAAVVIFGGIAIVLLMQPANKKITSFEECVLAGFPVIESSPRVCRAGGVTYYGNVSAKPTLPQEVSIESAPLTDDTIHVTAPVADAVIARPLVVEGEARGSWYFEASFPVILLDGNGEELAKGPAQATGDWMTDEFVPFSLTLSYEAPTTDTGVLVLMKDNPSGLPENDRSLKIPVRFK